MPTTDVDHATATRNAIAEVVTNLGNGGTLLIQTAADATLVTMTLPNPLRSGSAVGGVATFSAIATVNASATGTAAKYVVRTSGAADIFSGSVGAVGSGESMIVENTSVADGQPFRINSFSYTAPL